MVDNASDLILMGNQTTQRICVEPTAEQYEFYETFSWWLEGFGQVLVGGLGFLANCLAIPILTCSEMSSIFNRLLTCLAMIDNVFIVCSILESIRKYVGSTQVHEYLFGYFLYQFHNMVMCCSAYMTVVLAVERHRAVWRPIEYHNAVTVAGKPWRRVMSYTLPVVAFSILFNLPKFFETTFKEHWEQTTQYDELSQTNVTVNKTVLRLSASDLKLNELYVLWYSNVSRLLVTGITPFATLVYLNYRIHSIIRRRSEMNQRLRQSAASLAQKAVETKQAVVLFVIVILFFICHSLRIILNFHDLFTLDTLRASLENGCHGLPQWYLISASVSHFLITVNSSINFFIYCYVNNTFRKILLRNMRPVVSWCNASGTVSNTDSANTTRAAVQHLKMTVVTQHSPPSSSSPDRPHIKASIIDQHHLLPQQATPQQPSDSKTNPDETSPCTEIA